MSYLANKANILFQQYFNDYLQLNPLFATFIGIHTYDDQLPDFYSDGYHQEEKQLYLDYLSKADKVSTLSKQSKLTQKLNITRINLEAFRDMLLLKLEGLELPFLELPISQMDNIFLDFMSLVIESGFQPLTSDQELVNFRKRMLNFPSLIDSMIGKLKDGILTKRVLPRPIVKQVIVQLKDILQDKPYTVCQHKLTDHHYQQLIQIISKYYLPPLRKTLAFLQDSYLANSRETIGYSEMSMGKEMYQYLVKISISRYDLSIQKIHQLGHQETDRILEAMRKQLATLVIKDYANNQNFYLTNPKDVLAAYGEKKRYIANEILPTYFGDLRPPDDYQIVTVPKFDEKFNSTAYYRSPSINSNSNISSNRQGTFYVNMRNLQEHPTYNMEVLTLHEGNPGHHFQTSLSQISQQIPKFRSFDGGFLNAFVEGWGLYCETLGDYQDGYSLMGRYDYEIMRAARLAIDTGIHYYGWSFNKARAYLAKMTKMKASDLDAEIYRYISIPGQALSYKIGELSILDVRDTYLAKFQLNHKNNKNNKNNKNIINFHKSMMEIGPVPLWLLPAALINNNDNDNDNDN